MSKFFKDIRLNLSDNTKGLITDGSTYDPRSVQSCLNMDFDPTETSKRQPYKYQSTVPLESGYSLIGIYSKIFLDATGVQTEVLIAAAKKASNPTKIYVNKYFNPSTSYGNEHGCFGITGATYASGKVTITSAGHGLIAGDSIVITAVVGMTDLNDTVFSVYDSPTADTFRIVLTTAQTYTSGGTITKRGWVSGWTDLTEKVTLSGIAATAGTQVITNADANTPGAGQVTITSNGHGFIAGDYVYIDGIVGAIGSDLNGKFYTVVSAKTNAFVITQVTSGAYTSDGIVASDKRVRIEMANTNLNKADNYYKGWFIAGATGVNNIKGIVTKYTYEATAGKAYFYIAMSSYAYYVATSYTAPNYMRTDVIDTDLVVRFPVTAFNTSVWNNITSVSFEDTANCVRISTGTEGRIIRLDFLPEKQYFGTAANINVGTDYEYNPDWDGFWFAYDIPGILGKAHRTCFYCTEDGTRNPYADYGYEVTIIKPEDSTFTPVEIGCETGAQHYLDAMFDTDFKELGIIIKNSIVFNLVYVIVTGTGGEEYGNTNSYQEDMWALVMELDGYQSIFLRMFEGKRFGDTTYGSFTNYFKNCITTSVYYKVDFDRRLTKSSLYYDRANTFTDKKDDTVNPFLITNEAWSLKRITSNAVIIADSNLYNIPLNDDASHTIEQGWHCKESTPSWFFPVYPAVLAANDEYRSDFEQDPLNNGLSLNSFLNQYYYKDTWVKTKKLIKLQDNIVAIGISDDSVSTDATSDRNGAFKINISNMQQGGINCQSIFTDERVAQITDGEILISGESLIGNRFLIFSQLYCYHYELYDPVKYIYRLINKFKFRGISQQSNAIKAQYGDQFAGIYWAAEDGLYRFLDNYPESITHGRIEKWYQALPTATKAGIITGFLPRTKDVYFIIGGTVNLIYLWSITKEHFRIYSYTDMPEIMSNSLDAELVFLSGSKLFKTEGLSSTEWKDVRDNATPVTYAEIPFSITKYIDAGDRTQNKILDKIDLIYYDTAAARPVYLSLSAGANDSTTDILSAKQITLGGDFKKRIAARTRKRANTINLTLEATNTSRADIKLFRLKKMFINLKLGLKRLTEI